MEMRVLVVMVTIIVVLLLSDSMAKRRQRMRGRAHTIPAAVSYYDQLRARQVSHSAAPLVNHPVV